MRQYLIRLLLPLVIRAFVAAGLLVGVLNEAGIFTMSAIGALFVYSELHNIVHMVQTLRRSLFFEAIVPSGGLFKGK